jgi:hypothetical protein
LGDKAASASGWRLRHWSGFPYGVCDIAENAGWMSVGIDHDAASLAVNSIRRWSNILGRQRYPAAETLLNAADGGGGNGRRASLWKRELQTLAKEPGIEIAVCHLPPGTRKWNKIEHRLFSFMTQNGADAGSSAI